MGTAQQKEAGLRLMFLFRFPYFLACATPARRRDGRCGSEPVDQDAGGPEMGGSGSPIQPDGEIRLFFSCIIRWRIPAAQPMIILAATRARRAGMTERER
jgi:hypothetical protein